MSLVDNYIPGDVGGYEGDMVDRLRGGFNPDMYRPWLDRKGRPCVTLNTGQTETRKDGEGNLVCNSDGAPRQFPIRKSYLCADLLGRQGIWLPVWNATSLRKEDWLAMDKVVLKAVRSRLRAAADLSAANTYGGFDGWAKMGIEHEIATDPGEAQVDMDGTTEGRTDSVKFEPYATPLPVTHTDYSFSDRRLAISRSGSTPLDTFQAECAGRRVGEVLERMVIGITDYSGITVKGNVTYTRAAVYGYMNAPSRITGATVTTPTGENAKTTVDEVIAMRELAFAQNFFGPFVLYHSTDWDRYLDNDYVWMKTSGATAPTMTLRDRLEKIEGITAVRRLDMLTPANLGGTFGFILVQMDKEVCEMVNGMPVKTFQWDQKGGLQHCFRVMTIQVPRIREQYVSGTTTKKTGIVYAKAS